jgi:hypothetical protein
MERTTLGGSAIAWFRVGVVLVLIFVGMASCGPGRIKVTGKVETYEWFKFKGHKLRYYYSTGKTGSVPQGTAPLTAHGEFTFSVGRDVLRSGYFSIDGFYQQPPSSVVGGSRTGLPKDSGDQIDLGTVYIYNFIRILDNFQTPITLPEISLRWDSDVPAVDSYCVEIKALKPKGPETVVAICGIKDTEFNFSDVEQVLKKVGDYDVRGVRVEVRETGLHGVYVIGVTAMRTGAGNLIPVAISSLKKLTILDK